ncbi:MULTISPECIES: DUF4280 domain-containing protein [Francisella]|uniref:DUF4280 domain-containing protein n=1 Tax=Francisella opportunistica TaxID=2016517 RepID=A0A345JTJ3_9GAMM|nr:MULTISPECIES: DUF4280 domain-containing protein [Francisella]APC92438.1 hypothetical protein BBG19_1714 [Francisella sp. MA067296]AXH30639.1 DUF4280 domain-containing protein [Francisella opportunistica]AXH32279.1 DUF4280 domain-containing protein [Francisella opportunistica]AXH33928.1 DUF4280 domain-containing protein [Francisella opportunistica]
MSKQVCLGAQLKCSFGQSPSSLVVLPKPFSSNQKPAAVITDNAPMLNIPPFGMCSSPTNPAVIAATAAAMGVFTPAPCVPATTAPWSPGSSKVKINKIPSLTDKCKLNCAFGGIIEIQQPAQNKVDIE